MSEASETKVEVSVMQRAEGELAGFMVSGRWPATTLEWLRLLNIAVQFAAVPGLLNATTVFRVLEDLPEDPQPGMVGMVVAEGRVHGENALTPGLFAMFNPPGLFVLHPPAATRASLPEYGDAASGCILLPGIPYLGLDHRAGWVEADHCGHVASMRARSGINPMDDPDTAVLAMLLEAA